MYCRMPSVAMGIRRAPAANSNKGTAVMGPATSSHATVAVSPCTSAPCPCDDHMASAATATGASIMVSSASPSSAPSVATLRNRP